MEFKRYVSRAKNSANSVFWKEKPSMNYGWILSMEKPAKAGFKQELFAEAKRLKMVI